MNGQKFLIRALGQILAEHFLYILNYQQCFKGKCGRTRPLKKRHKRKERMHIDSEALCTMRYRPNASIWDMYFSCQPTKQKFGVGFAVIIVMSKNQIDYVTKLLTPINI